MRVLSSECFSFNIKYIRRRRAKRRWSMFENLMVLKTDILGLSCFLFVFFRTIKQSETYWFISFGNSSHTFIRRNRSPYSLTICPNLTPTDMFFFASPPGSEFYSGLIVTCCVKRGFSFCARKGTRNFGVRWWMREKAIIRPFLFLCCDLLSRNSYRKD